MRALQLQRSLIISALAAALGAGSAARAVDLGTAPAEGVPAAIPATELTVPTPEAGLREMLETMLSREASAEYLVPMEAAQDGAMAPFSEQSAARWNIVTGGPTAGLGGFDSASRWGEYSALQPVFSGFLSTASASQWSNGAPHPARAGQGAAQLVDAVYDVEVSRVRGNGSLFNAGFLPAGLSGSGAGATPPPDAPAGVLDAFDVRQDVANGLNLPAPAPAPVVASVTTTALPTVVVGGSITFSIPQVLLNVSGSPAINLFLSPAASPSSGPFSLPQTGLSYNLDPGSNAVVFVNSSTLPATVSGSITDPASNPLASITGGVGSGGTNGITIQRQP